jgi:hypothetical protein
MPEVAFLLKYEHDNIVKYYENFAFNDFLHIVTEYCEVYKLAKTNLDYS